MSMRCLMPGFANYSLRLGEEDKLTADGAAGPFGKNDRATALPLQRTTETPTTRAADDENRQRQMQGFSLCSE
jgi:hypothetical protein